jgi:hypothetical protein
VDAYRHYCWPVQSVSDLKLAAFHLLATEGQVHVQKNHVWHMEKLVELCKASDGLLRATPSQATAGYCFSPLFGLCRVSPDFAAFYPRNLKAHGSKGDSGNFP